MAANPRSGKQLMLLAAKKELKVLKEKAARAKEKCDRACTVGSELASLNVEFVKATNDLRGQALLDKLDEIKIKRDELKKLMNQSLVTLMDKEFETAFERDQLANEISVFEKWWSK